LLLRRCVVTLRFPHTLLRSPTTPRFWLPVTLPHTPFTTFAAAHAVHTVLPRSQLGLPAYALRDTGLRRQHPPALTVWFYTPTAFCRHGLDHLRFHTPTTPFTPAHLRLLDMDTPPPLRDADSAVLTKHRVTLPDYYGSGYAYHASTPFSSYAYMLLPPPLHYIITLVGLPQFRRRLVWFLLVWFWMPLPLLPRAVADSPHAPFPPHSPTLHTRFTALPVVICYARLLPWHYSLQFTVFSPHMPTYGSLCVHRGLLRAAVPHWRYVCGYSLNRSSVNAHAWRLRYAWLPVY